MSEYFELASVDDLAEGTMKQVDAEGHEFLVALVAGDYYVADARCPHLHGHLARGVLDGSIVTCPLHKSQFDLIDGHVVRWTNWTGAAKTVAEIARHPRPLRVYETRLEGNTLWVGPEKSPVAPE